jgi:hypothetical protein
MRHRVRLQRITARMRDIMGSRVGLRSRDRHISLIINNGDIGRGMRGVQGWNVGRGIVFEAARICNDRLITYWSIHGMAMKKVMKLWRWLLRNTEVTAMNFQSYYFGRALCSEAGNCVQF